MKNIKIKNWKPFDEGAFGDFIHDIFQMMFKEQISLHNYNIYQCKLFADNKRATYRNSLAPNKKLKQ